MPYPCHQRSVAMGSSTGSGCHKNRPDSVECRGIGHVDQILKSFLWSGILKDEIVGSRQDHNDVWMMRNNVSLKAG